MKYFFSLLILASFYSCNRLPVEKLSQTSLNTDVSVENDTLTIYVENSIHCPLKIDYKTDKRYFQETLSSRLPLILQPFNDTLISVPCQYSLEELKGKLAISFTAKTDTNESRVLSLPFPKGEKYKIIQGYNGSFSHNGSYSQFALDFNLLENDTICSAADGYVVGVIKGYKDGGKTKKWRDYANYITLYHPQLEIFTQYAHLVHNGSFVSVGDTVSKGQAIGLSGETGMANGEHLHFNVLGVVDGEMKSLKAAFEEGYMGVNLRRGDWVEK